MEGENIVKGYKVFNKNWQCRNSFQYEVGKKYTMPDKPKCCKKGFHFCLKLVDCFYNYAFDPENKVAEVEAFGDVDYYKDGAKACANGIKIVRELTWHEVLDLVNTGKNCTGFKNSGDCNSGVRNSGDRNNGKWNSGNNNSGDYNSGNLNKGNCNSGNENGGNNNSGDWNSGDRNSGDKNSGSWNSGNRNSGNRNSGSGNVGYGNSGSKNGGNNNSGDRNGGSYNSGDNNSGHGNTGYNNSGERNSGSCNGGHWNSGNHNKGNSNTGDWNTCNHSTGCFNTKQSTIKMFNKDSGMTWGEWNDCKAKHLLDSIPKNVEWVMSEDMTDKEKQEHPDYKTTNGYLKELDEIDSATLWWNNLSDKDKSVIKALPNFDWDIFCQCVSIDKEGANP